MDLLKFPKFIISQYKSSKKTLAFLTAMCMFFSALEYALPKPFPFFRLGLANIPIIISFYILAPINSVLLILLKIFVQNLISGTLFSYTILFSVAGSLASGLIMLLFYRLNLYIKGNLCDKLNLYNKLNLCKNDDLLSIKGLSLIGSFFNCLAQLGVSYFVILGENTKYIAPFFLATSFVTGLLLGILCEVFINKSKFFRVLQDLT